MDRYSASSSAIRWVARRPAADWAILETDERLLGLRLYGATVPGLEVADDAAWLDAFGVVPRTEEASGDEYVRELRIPTGEAEELHITWDVTDDSVRVRHRRAEAVVVDLYR